MGEGYCRPGEMPVCPVCINETLSFWLGLEGCSLKIRLPWKPKVFSLLGMLLDRGRERWWWGEQSLKKRHFSKILDSPSVHAWLLLASANCRRQGFVLVVDARRGSRGLLALGWMGHWTLPAAGTGICCGGCAGIAALERRATLLLWAPGPGQETAAGQGPWAVGDPAPCSPFPAPRG